MFAVASYSQIISGSPAATPRGALAQIEALGLDVVEVRELSGDSQAPEPAD
jgi:hypothetical protein